MIGLIILVVAAIYVALLIWATRAAYRWAKKRGLSKGKCWAVAAGGFFLIYLPVFWDHLPTLLAHKYYCEKEGGFWVYKTPEDWRAENTEATSTLPNQRRQEAKAIDGGTRFWIIPRLYADVKRNPNFAHAIGRTEEALIDAKTGEVLARAVDLWRGPSGNVIAMGSESIQEYKLWLGFGNRYCGNGVSPTESMRQFRLRVQKMGEAK